MRPSSTHHIAPYVRRKDGQLDTEMAFMSISGIKQSSEGVICNHPSLDRYRSPYITAEWFAAYYMRLKGQALLGVLDVVTAADTLPSSSVFQK